MAPSGKRKFIWWFPCITINFEGYVPAMVTRTFGRPATRRYTCKLFSRKFILIFSIIIWLYWNCFAPSFSLLILALFQAFKGTLSILQACSHIEIRFFKTKARHNSDRWYSNLCQVTYVFSADCCCMLTPLIQLLELQCRYFLLRKCGVWRWRPMRQVD